MAAIFSAVLAFGRVDLFRPVLAEIFDDLDQSGGPEAALHPKFHRPRWSSLYYRWTRGADLAILGGAIARLQTTGIETSFHGANAREALVSGIDTLRAAAVEEAKSQGFRIDGFSALPRGLRVLLPSPTDGSACKRWNMFLRWMVRADDGVDLGLWQTLSPARLIIPLDVHVGRIARFVGLTRRTDASWRTAEEVTNGLRAVDAQDPVRFDFALAHLGISQGCTGRFQAATCPTCPLFSVCEIGSQRIQGAHADASHL